MAQGRSGVVSSAFRRISPPNILPNSTRDEILPCRATSLEFRGVGEQKVSSSYTLAVWPPRMTVFSISYCTLHTTWKASGGPQWHTLKGHGNSAEEEEEEEDEKKEVDCLTNIRTFGCPDGICGE